MITVTDNSVQQINAALIAILREIEQLKTQNKELSDKIDNSTKTEEFNKSISNIDDTLEVCMQPRLSGGNSTFEAFGAEIAKDKHATACCGSRYIQNGPLGGMWYNYVYIPHKTGVDSDSSKYGTLLLFSMTSITSDIWISHLVNGGWSWPQRVGS